MPQGRGTGTRDHSTFDLKINLRQQVLEDIARHPLHDPRVPPVVLEAYGGSGAIYAKVYGPKRLLAPELPSVNVLPQIRQGVVLERDPTKVDRLALVRPNWAVYQGDTPPLLQAGLGGHLACDLWDIDPYGESLSTITALLMSARDGLRPSPALVWIAVNDGARQSLRRRAAAVWEADYLPKQIVDRYGTSLEMNYLTVVEEVLRASAGQAGYQLERFEGYYCGHVLQNTHFWARLARPA
jgi:hypothetical protein